MTIGIAQEKQVSTNNSVSTQAVTMTVTAGNSLQVFAVSGSSATVASFTCSDTLNGSYGTAKTQTNNATDAGRVWMFVFDNTAGGSNTITITASAAASFLGIWVKEISGTSGYDTQNGQVQTGPGTGTDAVSSGSANAPSFQPGLVSAISSNTTNQVAAAVGTGFTNGINADGAALGTGWSYAIFTDGSRSESQRYTSTSALAATFTASTGDNYTTIAGYFKESGGGGGGTSVAWLRA